MRCIETVISIEEYVVALSEINLRILGATKRSSLQVSVKLSFAVITKYSTGIMPLNSFVQYFLAYLTAVFDHCTGDPQNKAVQDRVGYD